MKVDFYLHYSNIVPDTKKKLFIELLFDKRNNSYLMPLVSIIFESLNKLNLPCKHQAKFLSNNFFLRIQKSHHSLYETTCLTL